MRFRELFNRKENHRDKPRANSFVLESLEPRLLLSATPMTAAVVTTDHLDYAPGETAVITTANTNGDGLHFSAGELVCFQVSRTDGMAAAAGTTPNVGPAGNEAWYVTDGVGGFTAHLGSDVSGDGVADWIAPDNDLTVNSSISTTWYVEEQYRNSSLLVTAVGQESGAVATQTFTDAIINTTTMVINSAPSGADTTITITENTPYTFSVADFGFTDPNDSPANGFQAVTITALPLDGTLTLNGTLVQAGASITLPPAGVTWTAHENNQQWHTVASSADGTRLVAGAYGGQLYTSTDAGVTWTARENNREWVSVASSADGTKLVAAALNWGTSGDRLYTSTDAGVTWTAHESNRQWRAVASSADGMQLVAGAYGGQLYTSSDAGVTWTAHESNRGWISVASSADGMQLVAGALGSQLYTSTDAGMTWTAHESNRDWLSVTSSADGMRLAAAVYGGQLYTSTDAGATWTAHESNRIWYSVASSADGTKLVAAADGGQLYTSTDAGVIWTAHENIQRWLAVASSADGSKLVAGAYNGQLYTSVPQPLGLVYTPAAGAHGTSLASISFQVQDSGGTANGGVNRDQTANTITLNVTPVHQPGTNNAPSGADKTLTITENTPYTFSVADFGFTDPNDSPANGFQSVTITALPTDGTLTLNGTPVQAGESIILPQAGVAWAAHESSQQWHTVASSADGTRLVAGAYGGQLYTSSDAGVTWTARESNRQWTSIASSADGMKLVASTLNWETSGDRLYTSTDAGVTWTARESNRQWRAVASSADGMQLVAGAYGGQLYTSSDAGVTWTARESNRGWISVASSADGMQLVAGALGSQLYTSTDAGMTWTAHESNRDWLSVASSADGMRLAAAVYGGQLYTSTDAGATWTAHESNRIWYSVASSADGTKLVAAADGGQLYTSTDAGVIWTAHENIQRWLAVASSADGSKLVAGAYNGQLYTSVPQPLGLVYTPAAGAHGTSLASISFQVQDSGGTANGGVNRDQTANTITLNVTPVHQPGTTAVASSASTSTYGQAVTFTATVSVAGGSAAPTGTVEFFNGTTSLGVVSTADSTGAGTSIWSMTTAGLTAGPHAIHAVYTATGAFSGSSSANMTQTVNKANVTLTVTGYFVTYDGNAHTATATAIGVKGEDLSAGLNLSGTTHTTAGTYTDVVTYTDTTGNYKSATKFVKDYISKANVTLTVTGYFVTYDGNAHTATATAIGVKGESLSGVALSGTTHTNAGTYTDAVTYTDTTGNYKNVTKFVKDYITKATPTLTATSYLVTYDGNAHEATGTAIGVKGETLSGVTGTLRTNAGTYTDAVTYTDTTGNYKSATKFVKDYISKANVTLTVTGYFVTYDGNAHEATATAIGVKGEDLSAGLNLSGTTHTTAGTYIDTVTFTDVTGNYKNASKLVKNFIT